MGTQTRVRKMIKVPYQHLATFNGYGYPYVDPRTFEMQWWVYRDLYQSVLASYGQLQPAVDGTR